MPFLVTKASLWLLFILGMASASAQSGWEYSPEAGAPIYSIYNADDHGGGAITCDIAEDRHGSLFFANEAGLLKFDGVHWTRMPETGQAYYTTAVTVDHRDRVWISGIKHLGYYEADANGTYNYTDITDSVMALPVGPDLAIFWKLYADGDDIYLISSFYVLRWDGNTWKVWPRFEEQRRILPTWLNGSLYIYARGSGLFRLDGDVFTLIAEETPEVASGIISIPSASEQLGLLCATIKNGLFYLKDGQFAAVPSEILPILQQTMVFHSLQCENGSILISTSSEGILIVDKSGRLIHQINDSSISNHRLIIDRHGTAWAATLTGIIQIKGLPVSHYTDAAYDITRHQNTLFYTNLNELKAIKPQDSSRSDNALLQFSTAATWDLLSIGPDLLSGTEQGLSVLTNKVDLIEIPHTRPPMYLFPSEFDTSLIYSVEAPKLGRWQKVAGKWEFIDTLEGLHNIVFSLVELPNGKLLLSGENGPVSYASWPLPGSNAEVTVTALGEAQGLPNQFNWAYCLSINNTIIVISDVGLFRYDLHTELFTYDPILGNDLGQDAYGLEVCPLADNDGWLLHLASTDSNQFRSGNIGALRIRADQTLVWESWQLPSIQNVGKVEALLHEKIDGKEILWVGGSKDLLRYDLSSLEIPPTASVRLTAITEDTSNSIHYGGAGDLPGDIEWSFPQKSLHFEFATPPTALEVRGYQTRLVGFEDQWSSPNERTFRDYTNLYEGSYQLEVRTIDELGRTGPTFQQSFTILPPLYRTWYAYLGYTFAGIVLIALGNRWWTLRLRKRNEELETMVNQRTIDLERRQIELIKANNVKQDFLANMSHEIRNPLNGILGITRLMRDDQASSAQPSERITHLYSCANHLHQLLGQTLDYSSLEAGKLSLHPQEFSPTHLANEVIGMHQSLLDEKGLELQVELPEVARHWIGDPVLLRQILINLISNAVKYTDEGSVRVKLSYEVNGSEVSARFEVADTGQGIPTEKQDYIFEKFTRLSKAAESTVSGTGLGLAIASETARLMGGTLTLDPQVEPGATFVLTLPFKLGDEIRQPDDEASRREPDQPLRGRRALIADDMDFNRYINKAVLERMGATVHETTDGITALHALETMHFDLAVLDINMPKLNGIEVVQSVLSNDSLLPPKFIALSAHTTAKMQASCLASGFDHFIEKPLDPIKLEGLMDCPIESAPTPRPTLDNSLMDYLAGNDPAAVAAIETRYRTSFMMEVEHLQQTLEGDDENAQSHSIHKLKGLMNFKKDTVISDLLDLLETHIDHGASANTYASLCQKMRVRIEQPQE